MSASALMYSSALCGYCGLAKALLARKGVAVEEVRIDLDPARRAEMLTRTGGQRTVPQIFIGEQYIGGFDELNALDRAGGLDVLLDRPN
jgi:glutaredoxin 3